VCSTLWQIPKQHKWVSFHSVIRVLTVDTSVPVGIAKALGRPVFEIFEFFGDGRIGCTFFHHRLPHLCVRPEGFLTKTQRFPQ
jgi:hypothetical protein